MRKYAFLFILFFVLPGIFAQIKPEAAKTDFKLSVDQSIPTGDESASSIYNRIVSAKVSTPKKTNSVNEFSAIRSAFTFEQAAKYLGLKKKGVLTISKDFFVYNEIDSLLFISGEDVGMDITYVLNKPGLNKGIQFWEPCVILDIDASFLTQHTVSIKKIQPVEDDNLKNILLEEIRKNSEEPPEYSPGFYLISKNRHKNFNDKDFFNLFYMEIYTIENVPADDFCIAAFYNKNDPKKRYQTSFFFTKKKIAFADHFSNYFCFSIDQKWYLSCLEGGNYGTGEWGKDLYVFENGEFKLLGFNSYAD